MSTAFRLAPFAALAVLFVFGSLGCSDHSTAGRGVSGETTNGTLSGIVLDAQGRPAAGVHVTALRETRFRDSATALIDTATTAADGSWILQGDPQWKGNTLVLARHPSDSSAVMLRVHSSADSDLQATLAPLRSFLVQAQHSATDPSQPINATYSFHLAGLGSQAANAADSASGAAVLTLTGIPAGDWLVELRANDPDDLGSYAQFLLPSASVPVSTPEASPVTVQLSSSPNLLLEDFSDDRGYSSLQSLLGNAWWGFWLDTLLDGARTQVWSALQRTYPDTGCWEGSCLQVGLRSSSGGDTNYTSGAHLLLGGADEDGQPKYHALPDLDTVAFAARGAGPLQFVVVARSLSDSMVVGMFVADVSLTSGWQEFQFATHAMRFVPRSWSSSTSLDWDNCEVVELRWQSNGTTDLWLDDVRLIGVEPTHFLPWSNP